MTRLLSILLVSVLVVPAGCDKPATRDLAAGLRFAWPAPATIQVREKVQKGGGGAELRYAVDLVPDGEFLIVRFRDLEFLELDGADLEDPEVVQSLQPVMAVARAIPDMKITRGGQLVDVVDFDQTLERVVKVLEESQPDNPVLAEELRRTLSDPGMVGALEQNAAQFWGAWVEMWLTFPDLAAGESATLERAVPAPDGSVIPGTLTYTHHGAAAEAAGHVRLSAIVRPEAESLTAAVTRFSIGQIARTDPEKARKLTAADLGRVEMTTEFEVITRPETLQPRFARFAKVVKATADDEQVLDLVERHTYTFDWGDR